MLLCSRSGFRLLPESGSLDRILANARMTSAPLPDTETRGLLALLPAGARPYALLARFDRPIGWWLLYWPCAFALALSGGMARQWPLLAWMLLSSIAISTPVSHAPADDRWRAAR